MGSGSPTSMAVAKTWTRSTSCAASTRRYTKNIRIFRRLPKSPQLGEWSHDTSLEWHVLQYPVHGGVQNWMEQLNRLYRSEPALHELDCDPAGFEWIDANDHTASVLSLLRKGASTQDVVLVVCNFTPVPRIGYRVGVPSSGFWREILNSDAKEYAGSGMGNMGGCEAKAEPAHGRPYSLSL